MCRILMLLILFAMSDWAQGQNAANGTLQSLHDLVAEVEAERDQTLSDLERSESDSRREWLQSRLDEQDRLLSGLRRNLDLWIVGGEPAAAEADDQSPRTLNQEVREILNPLLSEWREATAGPRELDRLKASLRQAREREATAARVVARIDSLREDAADPMLLDTLEISRRQWSARLSEAAGMARIIEDRIESISKDAPSTIETLSGFARGFWKSRGVNLLAALAAFLAVFWLTWIGYKFMADRRRARANRGVRFFARLTAVVAAVGSTVLAFGTALLVFYLRGDWLLLTLSALLLFGAVWTGRHTLVNYLDQVKLLLNIGPVREGERIVHGGLPWLVDRMGMVAEFHNPALSGGRLRIPLRMLDGMNSRPFAKDEPWFPTATGDWLLFPDDSFGRVVHQSPEQVVIEQKGGSMRTWPADDFLELAPVNLSHGFRVRVNFGLDYRHAEDITNSIPLKIAEVLKSRLAAACGDGNPVSVTVELTDAADSSLDLALRINFTADQASRYRELHRLTQSIAVDTAVAEGWTIPYPQRTIHHVPPEPTRGT